MELNLDWTEEPSALLPGVQYALRPLKVWAFQELMGAWEQAAPAGAEDPADPGRVPPLRLSGAGGAALLPLLRRVFAEHVRDLRGVTLRAEGAVRGAAVEDLCEEAALLPLAGEVLARLLARSDLAPAEVKN